ncbi:hypothetical protein WN943_027656 [Citrus x changshan-huyou]
MDWMEASEAHVFKADLLGLKKQKVKLKIEDDGTGCNGCQSLRVCFTDQFPNSGIRAIGCIFGVRNCSRIHVYGVRHYSRIRHTTLFTYTAYGTIHVYGVRHYSRIRYYSRETVEAIQEFCGAKQGIVV